MLDMDDKGVPLVCLQLGVAYVTVQNICAAGFTWSLLPFVTTSLHALFMPNLLMSGIKAMGT